MLVKKVLYSIRNWVLTLVQVSYVRECYWQMWETEVWLRVVLANV